MNKILQIEKKIFDISLINKLPFEFYDYLAQLIRNPFELLMISNKIDFDYYDRYFKKYKQPLIEKYLKLINDKNLLPKNTKTDSFTKAYFYNFISRYLDNFNKYAHYSIRRIPNDFEHGILQKFPQLDYESEIFQEFEIDEFIPKIFTGYVDEEKLKKNEKEKYDIASFFSALSSFPFLAETIYQSFKDITSYEYAFDGKKRDEHLQQLIEDISYETLMYFSRIFYFSYQNNSKVSDIIDSMTSYYASTVLPSTYSLPDELETLENNIYRILYFYLEPINYLKKEVKKTIIYELVQVLFRTIQTGLAIPENFYKVKIRDASDLDQIMFKNNISLDVIPLLDSNKKNKSGYESYALKISEGNMHQIIEETFQNEDFRERFINLDKKDNK